LSDVGITFEFALVTLDQGAEEFQARAHEVVGLAGVLARHDDPGHTHTHTHTHVLMPSSLKSCCITQAMTEAKRDIAFGKATAEAYKRDIALSKPRPKQHRSKDSQDTRGFRV